VSASYVSFIPGSNGTLSQGLDWLDYYVENLHYGTILTDFDEQMTRFPHAVFSLHKIANGTLDATEIRRVADPLQLHQVQIDRLMQQQTQTQVVIHNYNTGAIVMGDVFSNIGAGAVIVNRSSLTNALNNTRISCGSDAEAAVIELANLVEQSRNADAVESLNGLTDELGKPEPSKTRLRVWLEAITSSLPDVAQVAVAAAKVAGLIL
jgi:hypothetical protein